MNQAEAAFPEAIEPPLTLRILHSFAEAEPFRGVWNAFVVRVKGDIYQTFEWCEIWWKYYGHKRKLNLLLGFSGEELVAIVPAFVEKLWLGPTSVKIAKLIGADHSLTLCNVPAEFGAISQITVKAAEYFLGQLRCDLLLIGPLAGPTTAIDDILSACRSKPHLVSIAEIFGDTCNTFFTLPDTFEAYLKSLDKKQRSNFKRMIEQSSKAHAMTFDVLSSSDQVISEFERFRLQHESQWQSDGKLGHFGDWPDADKFNRDLIRTFSPRGMVRFYRILADDIVVSSQLCFAFESTLYWRLPARVRNPEWDRFSLGTMGLVKMVEALIAEGGRTIEGGRGHYGYKMHHGARESPLRTVQLMRRGFGVTTRVRLFRTCSSLLNLLYYKIIFARVAPKLRWLQHPLWPVWIRSTW